MRSCDVLSDASPSAFLAVSATSMAFLVSQMLRKYRLSINAKKAPLG